MIKLYQRGDKQGSYHDITRPEKKIDPIMRGGEMPEDPDQKNST